MNFNSKRIGITALAAVMLTGGCGFHRKKYENPITKDTEQPDKVLFDKAIGDIEVDYHHTMEDVGLVLGEAFAKSLGDRKGIQRYGYAVVPMDDALSTVAIDLSNRPYLVYTIPDLFVRQSAAYSNLFKEFFRAFANRAGMNLHIHAAYGENDHHVIESIFKAFTRALDQAASTDARVRRVHSSKGLL